MIAFGVLGPLTLRRDGEEQRVPTAVARRLLGLLLARMGEPVPVGVIVEELWSGNPPRTARPALQVHVSRLRRVLGDDDRVVTYPSGYAIHPRTDEFDSVRFEHLIASSAEASDPLIARTILREALGLWRGAAYDGMVDMPSVAAEADRLEHLRLAATEEAVQLDLDSGFDSAVIAELGIMIARHPFRERMRGQYMLALYRSGQQADALETYRQTYALLADELGVDPVPELQELHQRMLAGDPTLAYRPRVPVPPTIEAPAIRRPNLLPRSVADFTGRSEQMSRLDAIAAGDGSTSPVAILSAITGSAGIGKTALATHWARSAVDRFPDGQLYINLHGYGGGEPLGSLDALTLLLRELGVPVEEVPDDEQSAVARYRSVLSDRRTLVILDNANSAGQVRPLLPADPGCMAVITSRDRLAGLVALDGVRRVPIDVLSSEESVRLLATLLGAENTNAEPLATIALADVCGRLPLALRIAAAALVEEPSRSIAEHVALLSTDDRLPQLSIDGDPDSSVRTALSYSYVRLSEDARSMFRLLGVAPVADLGGPAAAALAGCSEDEAAASVDRLCAAHLLTEYAPGRYRFHDLIRDYAVELAAIEEPPQSRDAAVDRILTWYVAQAHNAETHLDPRTVPFDWVDTNVVVHPYPDPLSALGWFDLEGPNIIAAIHQAETIRPDRCWQLTASLFTWLRRRRNSREWIDIYSIGLAAARAAGDNSGETVMRRGVAIANCYAQHYAVALPHFVRILELKRADGDPVEIVRALTDMAVLIELERPDEAVPYLDEALAITEREPAAADLLPGILQQHGFAYSEMKQQDRSIEYYQRAITVAVERNLPSQVGSAANGLAATLMRLNRYDEAEEALQLSLARAVTMGDLVMQARAITNLGIVALDTGRFDEAQAYLVRAVNTHAEAEVDSLRDGLAAHFAEVSTG